MPDNIRDENLRLRELMTRLVADSRERRAKLQEERQRSRQLCDHNARPRLDRSREKQPPDGGPSEVTGDDRE